VRAMVTAKRDGDAAQTITPPAKPE
jgi:hypothetical protein